jgi:hypothetical protein
MTALCLMQLAGCSLADAALCAAQTLQVEGLCKLVGDVEEVAERAARAAQVVQVGRAARPN